MSVIIDVVGHNHFDVTWRRCFERDAVYNGVTVTSYADLQERCTLAWLDLAPRGYSWSEGQAAIWRVLLTRRTELMPRLRAEIAAGRLAVMHAGETVQDTNLPTAEGLVRNYLAAAPLYRDLCGEDHPGLAIGWQEDAFGNSANYPQILRGVGIEVAWRTGYRTVPGEVWVGLDGTAIPCLDYAACESAWDVTKHPPCDLCAGQGCATCDDSGLRLLPAPLSVLRTCERAVARLQGGDGAKEQRLDIPGGGGGDPTRMYLLVGGEETIPWAGALDDVAAANRRFTGQAEFRWSTCSDVWARHRDRLLALAAAQQGGTPTVDLNPAMPGCMVSRIALKLRTRAIAYRLGAAESVLADAAWRAGAPTTPPAALGEAWRDVAFCQFHDAITGTLIDSAARELHDRLDRAEAAAVTHLPPAAAPRASTFAAVAGDSGTIRLGTLEVVYDRRGIVRVLVGGRDLFGETRHNQLLPPFRIGELTLESDYGDAWGQRIAPLCGEQANFNLRPLGEFHERVEVAADALRWHGTYRGGHRKVRALSWTTTVRASRDGQRLEFSTEVEWDTESKRLRVVVPVASREPAATYEIPFGFLDRRYDASKSDYSQWNAHHNEFPILHWADRHVDGEAGVALLTRGLPCVRWMPGRFDLSLLRSPEWEFCQVEPAHYEFWDIDGLRDSGRHRFEYAVWPYLAGVGPSELTRAGYAWNQSDLVPPPFAIDGAVVVTAWKPAEDGQGWILRLHETAGSATTVRLAFAEERSVTPCDLLERPGRTGSIGTPGRGRTWSTGLHRHGILTVRIR